jgi:group I intron endonuclease
MIEGLKLKSYSVTGIYAIFRVGTNDCYVGQAVNIRTRWGTHRQDFKNNRHSSKFMQRVYNKHGLEIFEFVALEICAPEKLVEREAFWIGQLTPIYNSCPVAGSCLGYKHSDDVREAARQRMFGNKHAAGKTKSKEAREAQSLLMMGNKFAVGSPSPMKGKHHSEETKAKISQSKSGVPNLKKRGIPSPLKGIKRSEEIGQKISAGLTGHYVSDETKSKIRARAIARYKAKTGQMELAL